MKKENRFFHRLQDFDLSEPLSKRRYNEVLFSPVSRVYSTVTRVLSLGRDAVWKRLLVSYLPEADSPRVLDIACGTGELAFLTAGRYPGAEVMGIDLNADMLEKAREYLRRYPSSVRERVGFTAGDMQRLDFQDRSFDLLTGGYALRNAPELEGALREIERVLKPGGTAGFLEFSRSSRPFFSALQIGLLSWWGKLWGRIFHGNPEVYGYIAESLRHFPDNRAFCDLLEINGLHVLRHVPVFLGFLHITLVRRADEGAEAQGKV